MKTWYVSGRGPAATGTSEPRDAILETLGNPRRRTVPLLSLTVGTARGGELPLVAQGFE
jgi:hypothetical protein